MAALSTDAFQEKRLGTLLRSVRGRRRIAANAEFDAKKVWRAHVWPRRTDRTRIEIFDLSGAGSLERNYGRAISGTHSARLPIPGEAFARDDRRIGPTNARS